MKEDSPAMEKQKSRFFNYRKEADGFRQTVFPRHADPLLQSHVIINLNGALPGQITAQAAKKPFQQSFQFGNSDLFLRRLCDLHFFNIHGTDSKPPGTLKRNL